MSTAQDAAAQLHAAPPTSPTAAQCERIGILIGSFSATEVSVIYEPFDLPKGYVLVQLRAPNLPGTFVSGIDVDGRASS